MAGFDIWDVVKVPFPYTNRPVRQYRPALVVARYAGAGAPVLYWVLMITTASHRRWEGDVAITDSEAAGLPVASIVRCAKIATIDAADTSGIGTLPAGLRPEVSRLVAGLLGVPLGTGGHAESRARSGRPQL